MSGTQSDNLEQVKWTAIEQVQENQDNPREISEEQFNHLKASIENFPKMLEVRPIVVAEGVVLGGNMRLQALRDLGYTEVPVIEAKHLSDEQKNEFVIKDNTNVGDWAEDALLELLSQEQAVSFGVPEYVFAEPDFEEEETDEEQAGPGSDQSGDEPDGEPDTGYHHDHMIIPVECELEQYDRIRELHDRALEQDPKKPGEILLKALKLTTEKL